jgi:hypothetical protein
LKLKEAFHFFEEAELVYRLSKGLEKRDQGVIFLVGAALSAPLKSGSPGVLATDGMIDLIRTEFSGDRFQLDALDHALATAGDKRYQTAFLFLQGRLGQATANEIVKKAVLGARLANPDPRVCALDPRTASDDDLRMLDFDSGWQLNPGTEALGKHLKPLFEKGTASISKQRSMRTET